MTCSLVHKDNQLKDHEGKCFFLEDCSLWRSSMPPQAGKKIFTLGGAWSFQTGEYAGRDPEYLLERF